mmetsp:Transcript_56568/g.77099  ORF Transcript_56568/g.77099 Transcript_56568/m.77099 type:complete len:87 (-) Transcript_56568:380-640(-)
MSYGLIGNKQKASESQSAVCTVETDENASPFAVRGTRGVSRTMHLAGFIFSNNKNHKAGFDHTRRNNGITSDITAYMSPFYDVAPA